MDSAASSLARTAPVSPPRRGVRRRDLVLVAFAGILPVVLGRVVLALTPLPLHDSITLFSQFWVVVNGATWTAAMVLAYLRAPDRPMWVLILAFLWTDQIWLLGYVPLSLIWTISFMLTPVHDAVAGHVLVAFPSGILATRSDRRLVAGIYGFVLATSLAGQAVLLPAWLREPGCVGWCPENVFLVWRDDELARQIDIGSTLLIPFIALVVIAAVVRHWRGASPAGRRVLTPVLVATPLVAILTSLWYFAGDFGWVSVEEVLAGQLFLFVDFIVPVGLIVGFLRARFQRTAVADLAMELGRGVPIGGLRDALARVLRDPTLEVAFPTADGQGLVTADGRTVEVADSDGRRTTRLERDGELLAVLEYDAVAAAEDEGLVDAVGSVARLSLENERLAAQVRAQLEEVRASRARIVEAADEERRRVERDLHDGAQQRLVALAMRLQTAREHAAGSQSLLDEATAELRAAIAEVRDLARGLHPPILTERGLAAAVVALAERTPVPVVIDIPDERLPAPIEAAAYFVVAEALTNVVRYAAAREVQVSARADAERLILTVTDDGIGGADPSSGSGLRGLADRVAAVAGTLSIVSPPGGGTTVRVELPLG